MDRIKRDTLKDFIHTFCDKKETSKVRYSTCADHDKDFEGDPLELMNVPMLNKNQTMNYVSSLFSKDPSYEKLSVLKSTQMKLKYATKKGQSDADRALEIYQALAQEPEYKITIKQLNLLLSYQEIYRKNTNIQTENCHRIKKLLYCTPIAYGWKITTKQ